MQQDRLRSAGRSSEKEMEAPDFWDDPVKSQEKMKLLKSMKDDVLILSEPFAVYYNLIIHKSKAEEHM